MADQFLSQDEVDALLEGVNGESGAAADLPPAGDEPVRPYDLAKQERILRGPMPTLEIVNERFVRNLRGGLFEFMRRSPEVLAGPVKTQRYSAFFAELAVPTNINVLQVKPLRGNGLLIIEPQLVFAIIDSLFGGSGRTNTRVEARAFSATEQRIIERLVDLICVEYRKAWTGIYPLELSYVRSEMQPQFANIATPGEVVVTTAFSVEFAESSASIHLCIPYATLEPLRETLYSTPGTEQSSSPSDWPEKMSAQLADAEVELIAVLGGARITCAELLGLKKGDFIQLDVDETIEAKVDETPVLECRYGISNGHYALKLERFLNLSADPRPRGST